MKPSLSVERVQARAVAGQPAVLEMGVQGFPQPQLVWTHDGRPIEAGGRFKFLYDDQQNVSLVIKNVEMEDAGTYAVQAVNELGKDSAHMQLEVKGECGLVFCGSTVRLTDHSCSQPRRSSKVSRNTTV